MRSRAVWDESNALPIDGRATFATDRLRFATAATTMSDARTRPALSGAARAAVASLGGAVPPPWTVGVAAVTSGKVSGRLPVVHHPDRMMVRRRVYAPPDAHRHRPPGHAHHPASGGRRDGRRHRARARASRPSGRDADPSARRPWVCCLHRAVDLRLPEHDRGAGRSDEDRGPDRHRHRLPWRRRDPQVRGVDPGPDHGREPVVCRRGGDGRGHRCLGPRRSPARSSSSSRSGRSAG